MPRWVYRRPAAIRRRRFVPQTFAASRVVVRRRARVRLRRFLSLRRRSFVPAVTTFAATAPPVLRHAVRRLRRRPARMRRIGLVQGATAPTAGASPVRRVPRVKLRRLQRRPPRLRLTQTVEPPVTPTNKATILRMHKAVARMRRAMQARLRWKPRPEDTVADIVVDYVAQNAKGRIVFAGMTRGRLRDG